MDGNLVSTHFKQDMSGISKLNLSHRSTRSACICNMLQLLSTLVLSSAPKRMILSQLDAEVDASNLVLASRLSSPDVLLYFLHLHLLGAWG